MSLLQWLVTLSTLGTLVFAWGVYLSEKFTKHNTPLDDEEERLVELMGKVKVFVDSKLEILDQKLKEVKDTIKQLNESYVELLSKNVVEQSKGEDSVLSKAFFKEEKTNKSAKEYEPLDEEFEQPSAKKSIEEELYEMFLNGIDIVEIARQKKMGVGEVSLIIELMKRQGGR